MGESMDSSFDNEEGDTDPELQRLRELALTSQRVNYELMVENLRHKLQNVHCLYLFHFEGKEALRRICLCISSTPADLIHNSWKDLAGSLNVTSTQIGCIYNYNEDKTVLTLWTYSQKSEASLAQLTEAFLKIKRFDTVAVANELFPALAEFAAKDFERRLGKLGYEYNAVKDDIRGKLIRPEIHSLIYPAPKYITLEDPASWSSVASKKQIKCLDNPVKEIQLERVLNICSSPLNRAPKPKIGKKIMLTFARDCQNIANKVAEAFRKKRDNIHPCGVLMLGEQQERVAVDPFNFVTHKFQQAHYVVPILSPGYFEVLCDNSSHHLHEAEHLDESNITLIFNLMQQFYFVNKCINTKIRCIIPKIYKSVLNEYHFQINPIFMAYTSDDPNSIEELVCRLSRARKKS